MKSTIRSALCCVTLCFLLASQNVYSSEPSVSFYGLIDVFAGSLKAAGSNDRTLAVNSSGMTTSFIGVNTKIDLGDGLTGVATLESFLRPDTGEEGRYYNPVNSNNDQFFARDAFVGLEGKFGKIYLGRNTTPYFISVILTNPFVGSFGFAPSIYHSFLGGLAGDSGWSNSALYSSPTFGGMDISLLYSAGEVAGKTGTDRIGGNVFYRAGKFTGTVAYQSVDLFTWNNDPNNFGNNAYVVGDTQTADLLGVSYDLGVTKLFGQYMKMKTTAAVGNEEWKTYQLGATIPVGKGDIMASYANTDYSATGANTDRKTIAVGYDRPLNQKVDLYAVLNRDKPSTASNAGNALAFGGRFKF